MQLNRRLRDFILYIAIGVTSVGGFLLWLTYISPHYPVDAKWPTLAYFTAFLFGMVIRAYWRVPKSGKFWIVLLFLFALHLLVYTILLLRVREFSPIWYAITFVPEGGLIGGIVAFTTRILPRAKNGGRSIRDTLDLHH